MRRSLAFFLLLSLACAGTDDDTEPAADAIDAVASPDDGAPLDVAEPSDPGDEDVPVPSDVPETDGADVTYVPADISCPPIASTGTFDDAVGAWTVTGVCVGTVAIGLVQAFCPEAVLTRGDYHDWDGFIWLRDDGRFFQHARFATTIELYMPQDCVTIMGGDCDALAEMMLDFAQQTGAVGTGDCVPSPGGCLCTATGSGETGNLGVAEAAEGGMQIAYYDLDHAPSGALWSVVADGDTLTLYNQTTGKTFSGTAGSTPGACEVYCRAYWMGCRDVEVTAPYEGLDDCLEKCPDIPVAGSEQETGDSIECRLNQIFTGADPASGDPETFCRNAQFTPTGPCTDA